MEAKHTSPAEASPGNQSGYPPEQTLAGLALGSQAEASLTSEAKNMVFRCGKSFFVGFISEPEYPGSRKSDMHYGIQGF